MGKKSKKPAKRKTITLADLSRLAFCNSDKLPHTVEKDGQRLQWVSIGWVNEGKPKGDEVLVVD